MTIHFSSQQWQSLRENTEAWWQGKLNRPLIPVTLYGFEPERQQPPAPLLSQETCTDFRWSPEELVDRIDWELSQLRWLGDAYPIFYMDCFGPGILAAMLGAKLDNSTGRVWFWPDREVGIQDLHFEYDPENIWLNRVKDLYRAGMQKWQGRVLMGMTDLGGTVDVLSSFRPSEKLMFDLYDYPKDVERLTWEIHELWFRVFNEINEILTPMNPGFSDWSRIYSTQPTYILQCDFSYMIGPKMFRQLVLPELAAACRRLPRSFYHLDGPGEIAHQEMILSIPELGGMQWIPGDGNPDCSNWPEIYQRIHAHGKRMQVLGGVFDVLDAVIDQVGSGDSIHFNSIYGPAEAENEIRDRLKKYGFD
jgi:5-methyltetrahydrofolate--homocysteine methyltransferase